VRFPPANLQLRRAQLVLMLAVLLPTVAMTAVGIILLAIGSTATTVISGVLAGPLDGTRAYGGCRGGNFHLVHAGQKRNRNGDVPYFAAQGELEQSADVGRRGESGYLHRKCP
jgi:hypothetical protein